MGKLAEILKSFGANFDQFEAKQLQFIKAGREKLEIDINYHLRL